MFATTYTKSGTATYTAYGHLLGNKLYSVSVTSKFNYNGLKATYHSGFDYWYKRGLFSIWIVSAWKRWREASGTSYKGYASGNFKLGFEVKGRGMMIEKYYTRVTLTCDKTGKISGTYVNY